MSLRRRIIVAGIATLLVAGAGVLLAEGGISIASAASVRVTSSCTSGTTPVTMQTTQGTLAETATPCFDIISGSSGMVGSATTGPLSFPPVAAGKCEFVGLGNALTGANSCTLTPTLTQLALPTGGTAMNLFISTHGSPVQQNRFTLRINGAFTNLTCVVASGRTCSAKGSAVFGSGANNMDVAVSGACSNAAGCGSPGVVQWSVGFLHADGTD